MKTFEEFLEGKVIDAMIPPEKILFTGRVIKEKGQFWADRENIKTGEEICKPGDIIYFKYEGRLYKAKVTNTAVGRDDDMYLLKVISGGWEGSSSASAGKGSARPAQTRRKAA